MVRRTFFSALLLLGVVASSGCCCPQGLFRHDLCGGCDPHGGGTYWCGNGCGHKYWGDWLSFWPKRDPCNCCGQFTGSNCTEVPYQMPRAGSLSQAGYVEGMEGEIVDEGMMYDQGPVHSHHGFGKAGCNCGHH